MKDRLSDAVEAYLRHRKSANKAKNTIQNDKVTLVQLLTTVGNIYVENISHRKLDDFFDELADKGCSPATRATKHASLSSFFKWAHRTERTRRNPMEGREAPRWHKTERRRVPMAQFPALLEAAKNPRDRFYLALHLYTLCRTSEIRDMRIEDVDLQTGFLSARVFKGRIDDDLPITVELDKEIRRWLKAYARDIGEELQPRWRLAPAYEAPRLRAVPGGGRAMPDLKNRRLKPLGKIHNPQLIVHYALEAVGFATKDENGRPLREGTHTLRRSGARALYEVLRDDGDDGAKDTVQSLLHHKTSQQTEEYIGLDSKRALRNKRLRGQLMYPSLSADNVVGLKVVNEDHG